MTQSSIDYYRTPGPLTEVGAHQARLAALPSDIRSLVEAIPGLLVHEYWVGRYGVSPGEPRLNESHLRPIARVLDAIIALDGRPLVEPRAPQQRALGVCRHFA